MSSDSGDSEGTTRSPPRRQGKEGRGVGAASPASVTEIPERGAQAPRFTIIEGKRGQPLLEPFEAGMLRIPPPVVSVQFVVCRGNRKSGTVQPRIVGFEEKFGGAFREWKVDHGYRGAELVFIWIDARAPPDGRVIHPWETPKSLGWRASFEADPYTIGVTVRSGTHPSTHPRKKPPSGAARRRDASDSSESGSTG